MPEVTSYYFDPRKWRRHLRKNFKLTNPNTGEVWNGELDEPTRPRKPRERNFVFMDQTEAMNLVYAKVTGQPMRLLLVLISRCEFDNKTIIRRKELAAILGCSTQTLWTLVAKLREGKFVWPDPSDNSKFYINPMLCWKNNPALRTNAYNVYLQRFSSNTHAVLPLASAPSFARR